MQARVAAAKAELAKRFPELQKIEGHINNVYDARNPGPLIPDLAHTFLGSAYVEVTLSRTTILRRAGDAGPRKEFGRFYTTDEIISEVQVRIDKALRRKWIAKGTGEVTGTSPIAMVYETSFPAGTKVYIGQVGPQYGRGLSNDPGVLYVGGTGQVVLTEPWSVGTIVKSYP